jgi:hypothetical protein
MAWGRAQPRAPAAPQPRAPPQTAGPSARPNPGSGTSPRRDEARSHSHSSTRCAHRAAHHPSILPRPADFAGRTLATSNRACTTATSLRLCSRYPLPPQRGPRRDPQLPRSERWPPHIHSREPADAWPSKPPTEEETEMARTRKTTETVEQPENIVVELQPGIAEQAPVDQPDEATQAAAPDDQPEGEQPEAQARSRGFSLNEVRLIGRIAKEADVRVTSTGTHVAYLRVATNGLKDGDTEFHQLTAFGKTAEFAGHYPRQGPPGLRRGPAANPLLRRPRWRQALSGDDDPRQQTAPPGARLPPPGRRGRAGRSVASPDLLWCGSPSHLRQRLAAQGPQCERPYRQARQLRTDQQFRERLRPERRHDPHRPGQPSPQQRGEHGSARRGRLREQLLTRSGSWPESCAP